MLTWNFFKCRNPALCCLSLATKIPNQKSIMENLGGTAFCMRGSRTGLHQFVKFGSFHVLCRPSWKNAWGFRKFGGTILRGPHSKDYSIWGSMLGSPYLGKVPFCFKLSQATRVWASSSISSSHARMHPLNLKVHYNLDLTGVSCRQSL